MIRYCPDGCWTESGQKHIVDPGSSKTVGAFVRSVLTQRRMDRGTIHIRRPYESSLGRDTTPPSITYRNGQIIHSKNISEHLLTRELVSVTANDTWIHMDYMILCK